MNPKRMTLSSIFLLSISQLNFMNIRIHLTMSLHFRQMSGLVPRIDGFR